MVRDDPETVPVLAAALGLSRERLKGWLKQRFDTEGWKTIGRRQAHELVAALDEDLELVDRLQAQAEREWTWADVLATAMATRQRGTSAVRQGRDLEDVVEDRVRALGAGYETRTRFNGRGDQTAPADFVIPSGDHALIVVAVKGNDSTGSKLTEAVREIEEMAQTRTPQQYVFAVIDGLGWRRRKADLARIYALRERQDIAGMFTQAGLDDFSTALEDAARRVRLV